ncbi:acetyl-CoA synthetase [Pseudomonas aeruginosa]|nr:acetyl-CoA synthetase [Pseudomonas aeruginosa]
MVVWFVGCALATTGHNKNNTHVPRLKPCLRHPCTPCTRKRWHGTFTDEATYKTMYQQSVVNPDGFWREQAQRIDWIKPFEKVKQTSFDDHHVDIKWVRRRHPQRVAQLPRPSPRRTRRPGGDHLGRRRSRRPPGNHLPPAPRAGLQVRQRPARAGRAPRRRSDHLHADDPRGRGRHARLHPHRRDPLGGSSAASPPRPWPGASSIASRRW